jgi:RNA polymerase sigma factor (sigma-70 family)
MDPRQSKIVELKFFGGLTTEEIAEVMEISTATVEREWRTARAWLYSELNELKQRYKDEHMHRTL